MDDPHRWNGAQKDSHSHNGYGDRGPRFFSQDGKIIWYDLQTPKSRVFWLAGRELKSGKIIKYKIERETWSVHYNVSPEGRFFAGDGGGPRSVAAPGNRQWIYFFTPGRGALKVERLVDLSKHDYRLEPNISFTSDRKTDMTATVQDKYDALIEEGLIPQGRWGIPEDVGKVVAALVSGDFEYSTGTVIEVSGGMNIRRI